MAPNTVHVAVLDTDTPCLRVYKTRGLYSSQFRARLQGAAERLNKDPDCQLRNGPLAVHVTAFDAVGRSLPPLESLRVSPRSPNKPHTGGPLGFLGVIDAIMITGSMVASVYEDQPWIHELELFIQTVHTKFPHVKVFGACFGHQIIAQALLSAKFAPPSSTFHVEHAQSGYEIGIEPITLNPSFTMHFPPLARASSSQNTFRIQLIHYDQVVPTPEALAAAGTSCEVPLPAPWMKIGSSAQCPIQGLYSPGRVLTFQGHFEFDTFVNSELCEEVGRQANWPAPLVKSYVERISRSLVPGKDDDDDSKAAAEAVLLFIAGEDCPKTEWFFQDSGLITPPLEEHVVGWKV
ncbi:hypothetical protein N7510_003232 [Penicillium lagena]|uniref:uncharacterized protein n=1 Tax=Penicillium lagena TaxID=94218 RepID=UPI00253FD31B|nr:uncharacterized protein N7510_003232 [Penicillium lagena]KAJ5619248.1 hypothetical protein N7510_003232 [Penicillium lagena]